MKKKKKGYKIFVFIAFISFIGIIAYNLYIMYQNIDIKDESKYQAERTAVSTNYEENVENIIQNEENLPDIIEKVNKSVVGISKLKENGNSVFLTNGVEEMGIGSGVIISENGYILTNEHVSGSVNSTCYITMEEGKQYWLCGKEVRE